MPTNFIGVFCAQSLGAEEQRIKAHDRYLQRRATLAPYIQEEGMPLFILSATYGLIEVGEKIPYTDHLLTDDEVSSLVAVLIPQLRIHHIEGVGAINFYTTPNPIWAPYRRALKTACSSVLKTSARRAEIGVKICRLFEEI